MIIKTEVGTFICFKDILTFMFQEHLSAIKIESVDYWGIDVPARGTYTYDDIQSILSDPDACGQIDHIVSRSSVSGDAAKPQESENEADSLSAAPSSETRIVNNGCVYCGTSGGMHCIMYSRESGCCDFPVAPVRIGCPDDLYCELDMLSCDIRSMCVAHDREELDRMYLSALERLRAVYSYTSGVYAC